MGFIPKGLLKIHVYEYIQGGWWRSVVDLLLP